MKIMRKYWFINDLNLNASNLSIFNVFENNALEKMRATTENKKNDKNE